MAAETEYDEPVTVREGAEPTVPDFTVGSWVHIQIVDGRVADVHLRGGVHWHAAMDHLIQALAIARGIEAAMVAELYREATARVEANAKAAAQRRGTFLAAILDRAMGR